MPRDTRRSGMSLVLAGAAGISFFVLTDPKWGVLRHTSTDVVDSVQQAWPGTYIGIGGGATIILFGMWLLFFPLAIIGPCMFFRFSSIGPEVLTTNLASLCALIVLFRTTRNYIVKSRLARSRDA